MQFRNCKEVTCSLNIRISHRDVSHKGVTKAVGLCLKDIWIWDVRSDVRYGIAARCESSYFVLFNVGTIGCCGMCSMYKRNNKLIQTFGLKNWKKYVIRHTWTWIGLQNWNGSQRNRLWVWASEPFGSLWARGAGCCTSGDESGDILE
jgi:hypothetical protein